MASGTGDARCRVCEAHDLAHLFTPKAVCRVERQGLDWELQVIAQLLAVDFTLAVLESRAREPEAWRPLQHQEAFELPAVREIGQVDGAVTVLTKQAAASCLPVDLSASGSPSRHLEGMRDLVARRCCP